MRSKRLADRHSATRPNKQARTSKARSAGSNCTLRSAVDPDNPREARAALGTAASQLAGSLAAAGPAEAAVAARHERHARGRGEAHDAGLAVAAPRRRRRCGGRGRAGRLGPSVKEAVRFRNSPPGRSIWGPLGPSYLQSSRRAPLLHLCGRRSLVAGEFDV